MCWILPILLYTAILRLPQHALCRWAELSWLCQRTPCSMLLAEFGSSRIHKGGKRVSVSHLFPSTEVTSPVRQLSSVTPPPCAPPNQEWALASSSHEEQPQNLSGYRSKHLVFCSQVQCHRPPVALLGPADLDPDCHLGPQLLHKLPPSESCSTFFSRRMTDT